MQKCGKLVNVQLLWKRPAILAVPNDHLEPDTYTGGSGHHVRTKVRPLPHHPEHQLLGSSRYPPGHRSHELVDELEHRHPRRIPASASSTIFVLWPKPSRGESLAYWRSGSRRYPCSPRRPGRCPPPSSPRTLPRSSLIPHLEGGFDQLAPGIPGPGLNESGTTWRRAGAGSHARDVIGCLCR